jgi:hypothetical protein
MDRHPDSGDNTTLAPKPVTKERRQSIRRIADKLGGGLSFSLNSNVLRWTQ